MWSAEQILWVSRPSVTYVYNTSLQHNLWMTAHTLYTHSSPKRYWSVGARTNKTIHRLSTGWGYFMQCLHKFAHTLYMIRLISFSLLHSFMLFDVAVLCVALWTWRNVVLFPNVLYQLYIIEMKIKAWLDSINWVRRRLPFHVGRWFSLCWITLHQIFEIEDKKTKFRC